MGLLKCPVCQATMSDPNPPHPQLDAELAECARMNLGEFLQQNPDMRMAHPILGLVEVQLEAVSRRMMDRWMGGGHGRPAAVTGRRVAGAHPARTPPGTAA